MPGKKIRILFQKSINFIKLKEFSFQIQKMGLDKSSIKHLVNNVLREDGVLLLKFVENFAGARMKRDLVIQLLKGEYPAVQPRV